MLQSANDRGILQLKTEIDELKNELDENIAINNIITNDVLKTSQKLDQLIVQYTKMFLTYKCFN